MFFFQIKTHDIQPSYYYYILQLQLEGPNYDIFFLKYCSVGNVRFLKVEERCFKIKTHDIQPFHYYISCS